MRSSKIIQPNILFPLGHYNDDVTTWQTNWWTSLAENGITSAEEGRWETALGYRSCLPLPQKPITLTIGREWCQRKLLPLDISSQRNITFTTFLLLEMLMTGQALRSHSQLPMMMMMMTPDTPLCYIIYTQKHAYSMIHNDQVVATVSLNLKRRRRRRRNERNSWVKVKTRGSQVYNTALQRVRSNWVVLARVQRI